MGEVISDSTEKYGKTEHSKVKCFLNISPEAEIHTISKA